MKNKVKEGEKPQKNGGEGESSKKLGKSRRKYSEKQGKGQRKQ